MRRLETRKTWTMPALNLAWYGYYNERPPREAFPKAKAAAEQAIALNGTLGEAYASLGYSLIFHDWDWAEAERAFRQAARLAQATSASSIGKPGCISRAGNSTRR